jgi:hypothetical protein
MDPFKQIGKQLSSVIKESRERWRRIESEESDIKERIRQGTPIDNTQLAGLLLMVIEQIRPLYTYNDIEPDVEDIVKKMLKKK